MDHPIQGLMKAAMENLKEMVDVNTIVGEPVQTADGGVVLTVSKVAFGFGAEVLTSKRMTDKERTVTLHLVAVAQGVFLLRQ